MSQWRDYEQRTAGLLTDLGFSTTVQDTLHGADDVPYKIDVTARRQLAGVSLLWILECKLHSSPVTRDMVNTLKAKVDDVGADRGLLMSESGFQSGAIRYARRRNITLTSLDDLAANAIDDLTDARLNACRIRALRLEERRRALLVPTMQIQFARDTVETLRVLLGEDGRAKMARRPDPWESPVAQAQLLELVGIDQMNSFLESLPSLPKTDQDPSAPLVISSKFVPGVDAHTINTIMMGVSQLGSMVLDPVALGQLPIYFPVGDVLYEAWSPRQAAAIAEQVLTELETTMQDEETRAADAVGR
ncbi:restriction endonuclease [Nonomuraea angiospora]|uniref:restriction endonuclease n=1 Tax=Nonomuraea angiospora TaxID=46172 RepID=UPI00344E762C